MKKTILITAVAMSISLFGADYASMSTDQLMNMRGTLSAAEHPAFSEELQKRVQNMSDEEKAKYNVGRGLGGSPRGGGMGQGAGRGMMPQDGSGGGMGGR
jgi:hypothetical protein